MNNFIAIMENLKLKSIKCMQISKFSDCMPRPHIGYF